MVKGLKALLAQCGLNHTSSCPADKIVTFDSSPASPPSFSPLASAVLLDLAHQQNRYLEDLHSGSALQCV